MSRPCPHMPVSHAPEHSARAAAANSANTDFYFLGPPLPDGAVASAACNNCVSLPLDVDALLERVAKFLGLPRGSVELDDRGRKLCDMKPMWAALFPELTARHEYIGYSDHDILLGDLASEVARLRPAEHDMLTPLAWFPQPLTNGNLLLVRTTRKMVHAFRRSPVWRQALRQRSIWVFDEHWGTAAGLQQSGGGGSMHHVYHSMLLSGELRVYPTARILVQASLWPRTHCARALRAGIQTRPCAPSPPSHTSPHAPSGRDPRALPRASTGHRLHAGQARARALPDHRLLRRDGALPLGGGAPKAAASVRWCEGASAATHDCFPGGAAARWAS